MAPPAYKLGDLVATREAFGAALAALGEANSSVVALDADVKNSTFTDKFGKQFPDRFFENFIAEQNMIGAAIAIGKRAEARPVVTAARIAAASIVLQVLVAAAMVETRLPPALQSIHQAVGTLVWVAVIAFALLARRGAGSLGEVRANVGHAPLAAPRGAES